MNITKKTKTNDILPLLNGERLERLIENCPAVPLDVPVIKMTCGQFIGAMDVDYSLTFLQEKYALNAIGKLRQFRKEMGEVCDYIKRLQPQQTADEQQASVGVDFPNLKERILLDVAEYFRLHSFSEAEQTPIADWLLVLKAKSANAKYERNFQKITANKIGKK